MQGTLDAILQAICLQWPADGALAGRERTSYAGPADSGPTRRCRHRRCQDDPPPGVQSDAGGRRSLHGRRTEAGRLRHLRRARPAGAQRDGERQGPSGCPASFGAWRDPPPHRPVQSRASRPAQRRAPLRSERAAVQPVPRSRPAILLRLLPARRRDAGGGADRQEATHRGEAVPRPAGPRGARHRLRLGRAGADAGARSRRAGDWASRCPPNS